MIYNFTIAITRIHFATWEMQSDIQTLKKLNFNLAKRTRFYSRRRYANFGDFNHLFL